MLRPDIKTSRQVVPMIYGYSTPEVMRHNGWTKIGYTEQEVETRIKQQTHTADVSWHLEWKGNATFDDGSGQTFTDKDFHAYLRKSGVEQEAGKNNEWFHISGQASKQMFRDFREDHGILKTVDTVIPYKLREEQERAVAMTACYQKTHKNGEFLWNAKPRFGKTLSVYDFVKRTGARNVLIVTNRPAIANSWYSDYEKFIGRESGYLFVSEVDALKGRKGVLTRDEYRTAVCTADEDRFVGCIEFVSLQDMKGSLYFGGEHDKLAEISDAKDEKGNYRGMEWDVLVIDEAHEGVDTYRTDVAFEHVRRKFTLHLSGTPFKALAGNKFNSDAIFNWTYTDEQERKRKWDNSSEEENPYEALPKLNLYTYQMSEIIKDELRQGIEINGETKEYAFDLNEFFAVSDGKFIYDSSVDKFLDALTRLNKYPFSTPELRNELKHTFWLLNRVDSARALAKKLREHPVFQDYKVIEAVGNGKDDDSDETKKSYDKVVKAIAENDKTITLSVGQLTTGVTIPEWTAVLMLSNMKSPALYMQAAFRAQNPCLFKEGTQFKRKENSYVFDFDPARTLTIYEEFANNLNPDTAGGSGTAEKRKENIRTLLNFFPVIGEDEQGELVELDAEKVLTIPRKIKSVEVVKRGFMSNFLFSNISNIFGASGEVLDIIRKLSPVEEPKNKVNLTEELKKDLSLDENGEVSLSEELIKEKVQDIFGNKIYDVTMQVNDTFSQIECEPDESKKAVDRLKEILKQSSIKSMVEYAQDSYGLDIKASDKRQIEAKLNHEADKRIDRMHAEYQIQKNVLEKQRVEAQQSRDVTGKSSSEIEKEFEEKKKEVFDKFKEELSGVITDMAEETARTTVETVEINKREREKDAVMDGVRDRLRGFSRTIPSFLMAYGDDTVTLENFDTIIPDDVFKEVTGITLGEFRLLRDGGDYTDEETGEPKHFNGQLFDSLVFNDSVKEFLSLKKKLANYFDENNTEDIFDYIPPQKTNQIFTPKAVVKKMVDMLEQENPGCFDMPDKTFIDLYMKSGLYIAEIVKRLYRSEAMKKRFPDGKERLRHIFEKQVYGLAPTEIIYRIATNYILGFNEESKDIMHNFRQVDALPYAKEGTLSKELDGLYSAQK
ncbi:MAG: DEAD/DEAH box helicase family protein [Butyrivibrio sp.]